MIAATKIRPLLPDLPELENSPRGELAWTEYTVRPLTHKRFQPSDVRRIGKKVLTMVKRENKLTAPMVKAICDEELGVVRKKRKKMKKALQKASLAENIKAAQENVQQFLVALQMYEVEAWYEVEETNPQLVKSFIRDLDLLTSFLKE